MRIGTDIWVYFGTSKQNEANRWKKATVVKKITYNVWYMSSKRGPSMSLAYEEICIVSTDDQTMSLREELKENALVYTTSAQYC